MNLAGESLDLFWINIFNEELLYQRPDEYRKVNPTSIQNGSEVTVSLFLIHNLNHAEDDSVFLRFLFKFQHEAQLSGKSQITCKTFIVSAH